MNYLAAITDFFKSPKWMMNMLLGGVCCMIPIVGPIVLIGWLITGFWARQDKQLETFPDFDFNKFTKYMERGVWPFVVGLVGSLVLMPLMFVVMVPSFMMMAAAGSNSEHPNGLMMMMAMLLMFVGMLLMGVLMNLVMVPLMIRAGRLQDFATSFSWKFVKDFLKRMWKEMLLAGLTLMAAAVVLGGVGYLLICIGVYLAIPLIYFAMMHLQVQLYDLYLSRGGEAVPLSPKLTDLAPPLPPSMSQS